MSVDISDSNGETVVQGQTRRDVLKRIGVASGSVVAIVAGGSQVAPRYSPVGRAQAVAPVVPIGVLAGAAGVKYLTGKSVGEHAIDLFTGNDEDLSGYIGADALHLAIATGAQEMRSADERVMTSITNNIQNSENVALAKGKAAIVEKMNAGESESAAQTAMQDAIDEYYSTIQENILNHWNSQISQINHMWEQLASHDNISPDDVIDAQEDRDDYYVNQPELEYEELELLNGDTIDAHAPFVYNRREAGQNLMSEFSSGESNGYRVSGPDGNSTDVIASADYWSVWNDVISARNSVNSDLSGFISDVFLQYEPGDIPTENLVDPITASTELRQDYDNASGQSAHAAMLGIPTTAELSADLEIQSDEAEDGVWEVEADLFTAHVPRDDVTDAASIDSSGVLTLTTEPADGATYAVETTDDETVDVDAGDLSADGDSWTVDISGDLSTADTSVDRVLGEEIGFESGETYQPSDWSDPFYIAYNYVDDLTGEERGDFTQIESEFTIVSVTNSDGESVESFRPESRNNQTSDVSTLKGELERLREQQIAMQEEAQEEDDSSLTFPSIGDSLGFGDLGWLTDDIAGIPVWGWIVGVAGFLSVTGDS